MQLDEQFLRDSLSEGLIEALKDAKQQDVWAKAISQELGLNPLLVRIVLKCALRYFVIPSVEWAGKKCQSKSIELLKSIPGAKEILSKLSQAYQEKSAYTEIVQTEDGVSRKFLSDDLQGILKILSELDTIDGKVDQLLYPQPSLTLNQRRGGSADSITYHYSYEQTPFLGREKELALLKQFLYEDTRPFVWQLITGAGGVGKSRLALHLCCYHAPGYRVGFLFGELDPQWVPTEPTFIVIDYASQQRTDLLKTFQNYEQRQHTWTEPVRILLLERDEFLLQSSDFHKVKSCSFGPVCHLETLTEENLWQLMNEILTQKGVTTSNVDKQSTLKLLSSIDPLRQRPLYAAYTAEAIAENITQAERLTHLELLDFILDREMDHRWNPLLPDRSERKRYENLIILATIMAGCPDSILDDESLSVSLLPNPDIFEKVTYHRLLDCEDNGLYLPPMEPDILGERLLIRFLEDKNRTDSNKQKLMDVAWQHPKSAIYYVLYRLAQDFKVLDTETTLFRRFVKFADPHDPKQLGHLVRAMCNWVILVDNLQEKAAIIEDLRTFHRNYGQVPLVWDVLSGALLNWASGNTLEVRKSVVEELWTLHEQHNQDPDIRKRLAKALNFCSEVDQHGREEFVSKLRSLHENFGEEYVVRRELAIALFNWTHENSLPIRESVVAELRALHKDFGEEPFVREQLAGALVNLTFENTLQARVEGVTELRTLHKDYDQEPNIREALAMALHNLCNVVETPPDRASIVEELRSLHEIYGQESTIRQKLAVALSKWAAVVNVPATCKEIITELRSLYENYGQEAVVLGSLARAMNNPSVEFDTVEVREAIATQLRNLYEHSGKGIFVLRQLALALCNSSFGHSLEAREAIVAELRRLHESSGQDSFVRQQLVAVLCNWSVGNSFSIKTLVVQELRTLHTSHGEEAQVRNGLAQALATWAFGQSFTAIEAIVEELRSLYHDYGQESFVRNQLFKVLYLWGLGNTFAAQEKIKNEILELENKVITYLGAQNPHSLISVQKLLFP